MIILLSIVYFFLLFITLHSYILYPLLIAFWSKRANNKNSYDINYITSVSVIISAYNEERTIEYTIKQVLNSDYDLNKIEIIIGSDKSEDRTNEIINNLTKKYKNIKFYSFLERRGKSAVLNDLVKNASNEVLIFMDANSFIHHDTIRLLVRHYISEDIGGVCGRLVLVDDKGKPGAGFEEKNYWKIESILKNLEGDLGIVIGANGGIYSIRKKLFKPIPTEYPVMDDFYISMKILEQGRKMIYEKKAIAEESISESIGVEFRRKIRNNAIMMSTLRALKKLLKPSFGIVSFAFWSHKVIRWFSPHIFVLIFLINLFLFNVALFFKIILFIQIIHLLLSVVGYFMRTKFYFPKILSMPFYFTLTNFAMMIGFYKFLRKTQTSYWQSTPRK